jgi:hypothetical protein
MGAGSWALPPVPAGAGLGEVAGRGEFVAEVVEGIGFAFGGGAEGGACGGNQVVIAAADDRDGGVKKVDLIAERRDRVERLGEDATGCGCEQGADDGMRPG